MNCWHFGFCGWIWWPSFLRQKMKSGGLCRWPPNTFWKKMETNGRRIDAEFNSNSTRHHSNKLNYPAQGNWQHPHNPQQNLLPCLPFFHDCLTPKLPRIHSQIHSAHSGRKQRPDTHKPKHSIEHTPTLNIAHISTTPRPWSQQALPSSQTAKPSNIHRFRPVLPSSFCISLRPSRRAVLSRRHPMFKDGFLPQRLH